MKFILLHNRLDVHKVKDKALQTGWYKEENYAFDI